VARPYGAQDALFSSVLVPVALARLGADKWVASTNVTPPEARAPGPEVGLLGCQPDARLRTSLTFTTRDGSRALRTRRGPPNERMSRALVQQAEARAATRQRMLERDLAAQIPLRGQVPASSPSETTLKRGEPMMLLLAISAEIGVSSI
jgi:hypothetical protein